MVSYSVTGLVMGALADIVHRPRLVAAAVALWSILTAASGAARGFVGLAIPRMLIAVGESALTPSAMSMLADRFPLSRLGFAAGFYFSGVPLGFGLSLLIAGYLGPTIGWRNCFYALGGIGVALSLIMLLVRETPRRHIPGSGGSRDERTITHKLTTLLRVLKLSPALRWTIIGGVFLHLIIAATAFDQLWYVHERGCERARIAQMVGWIGVVGGVLGNFFGGIGSDWWKQHREGGRTRFFFWVILVLLPVIVVYRLVEPSSILFWIGIFATFFLLGAFYGPAFSTVQDLVPPGIRATVVALYILTNSVLGVGLGISAAGYVIDHLIAAGATQPYSATLLVLTVLSMAAIPSFHAAARRFESDRGRVYRAAADGNL